MWLVCGHALACHSLLRWIARSDLPGFLLSSLTLCAFYTGRSGGPGGAGIFQGGTGRSHGWWSRICVFCHQSPCPSLQSIVPLRVAGTSALLTHTVLRVHGAASWTLPRPTESPCAGWVGGTAQEYFWLVRSAELLHPPKSAAGRGTSQLHDAQLSRPSSSPSFMLAGMGLSGQNGVSCSKISLPPACLHFLPPTGPDVHSDPRGQDL